MPVIRYLILIAVFLFIHVTHARAAGAGLSLALVNAGLGDAIRLVAQATHINVIISPAVQGSVTMQLEDASPRGVFEMLLGSRGLAMRRLGDVWYIAPRDELIKSTQEEQKWQEIQDDASPLVTRVLQIRYAKADDIARLLRDEHQTFLSRRGRVKVDARTNILCLQELPANIGVINAMIRRLDVPVQQIAIDARLVSVDDDVERELGIRFNVRGKARSDNSLPLSNSGSDGYSLAIARLADNSLLDVRLSALENAGHAELISSPSLFTANQQAASIEAGEEVPYQEVSDSGGTAVAFKKAVLGLKVTPQVLPGNRVLLQLQINQDRPGSRMVQGMPAITTRQIITSVLVGNGKTIVLGGIYETGNENGQQRLPFVSRIPGLGLLFQQKTDRENKREMLIFVTPRIIN